MFLCFRPFLWECLTYLEYHACPARDELTISILGNTSIHFQSYLMLQLASVNHWDYSYRNVQKHKYQNLFCVLLNIQGQIISKPCSIVLRKLPGLTFSKLLLFSASKNHIQLSIKKYFFFSNWISRQSRYPHMHFSSLWYSNYSLLANTCEGYTCSPFLSLLFFSITWWIWDSEHFWRLTFHLLFVLLG